MTALRLAAGGLLGLALVWGGYVTGVGMVCREVRRPLRQLSNELSRTGRWTPGCTDLLVEASAAGDVRNWRWWPA